MTVSPSPFPTPGSQAWDPTLYRQAASFVTSAGDDLIDMLEVRAGEHILDIGCGTGEHVAELSRRGGRAEGIDASAAMIAEARRRHPGCSFVVGDVRSLPWKHWFDGILSNACLHWVPDADLAARAMYQALRPRGRLVLELGGERNVAGVIAAVDAALAEQGRSWQWHQWYFPSPGTYAGVLERNGFRVLLVHCFERPSLVMRTDALSGVAVWLTLFAPALLAGLGEQRSAFLARVEALSAPSLRRGDDWIIDYVRLRMVAVRRT